MKTPHLTPTPFQRLLSLTKRIIAVPKAEIKLKGRKKRQLERPRAAKKA